MRRVSWNFGNTHRLQRFRKLLPGQITCFAAEVAIAKLKQGSSSFMGWQVRE